MIWAKREPSTTRFYELWLGTSATGPHLMKGHCLFALNFERRIEAYVKILDQISFLGLDQRSFPFRTNCLAIFAPIIKKTIFLSIIQTISTKGSHNLWAVFDMEQLFDRYVCPHGAVKHEGSSYKKFSSVTAIANQFKAHLKILG